VPEHTSLLTLVLAYVKETLSDNAHHIGDSLIGNEPANWQSFEPIGASLCVVLIILVLTLMVRRGLRQLDEAVIPEEHLTIRTFFEAFLGYFYDLSKSVMGPERAKRYYPIVGTSAIFVFISNALAIIPGMPIATSSLNITLGCALVVFILFNAYGLAANGLAYIKHIAGPAWYLWWLTFPVEVISLCVRPVTLSVRLMLNMSVDHLVLGIIMGLVAVLVPIPVMLLGCIIIVVQTLVFTLLTIIYIALATEDMAHH
jgi:F-type H+-transporting ATPase subunit a